MMQADDTLEEEEKERSHSRRRRSSIKTTKRKILSLAPNLGLLSFYICFYSFLCGLYLLLLKGVTSTPVGGQETLLWAFFYLGITFVFVVSVSTYASQWEEKKQAQTDASSKRSSLSSLTESESRALMNEPPPPPAAAAASDEDLHGSTTIDDDLDDIELVSEAKSSMIDDSKHIGDVDVS